MRHRRGKTAAEFVAELNVDPEYVERRQKFQEELDATAEYLRLAEAPLVEALNNAGLGWVRSVWDLVNTAEPYPQVLEILLDHLQRAYPAKIAEGIARALAVQESRQYWNTLLRTFRSHPDGAVPNGVKFAIGCALAASADESVLGDVIALVRDPRHGENRGVFLKLLISSLSPKAQAAFDEASRDPQLAKEAQFLKRLRQRQVRKRKSEREN